MVPAVRLSPPFYLCRFLAYITTYNQLFPSLPALHHYSTIHFVARRPSRALNSCTCFLAFPSRCGPSLLLPSSLSSFVRIVFGCVYFILIFSPVTLTHLKLLCTIRDYLRISSSSCIYYAFSFLFLLPTLPAFSFLISHQGQGIKEAEIYTAYTTL